MSRPDPHSYADDTQPTLERLELRARVDVPSRTLACEAQLAFSRAGTVDLDTRGLAIEACDARHELAAPDGFLGQRLRVELTRPSLTIRYRTSPDASALQWLEPAQTAGKRQPFLFSQCQAIHARSLVPIQDTPRVRIRYSCQLEVPRALRGLMAAAHRGREERGEFAVEKWEMPQPIPPYLIAFAVGDLQSRELGPRSRVWAEPAIVDAAAREFAEVDAMLTAAESLFGAYDWERFDLLVMPPSFPYGGMENPRLTFLTPTLLAGDRSLVSVVAHELAHSWTGNLVCNASAEHFWLNEGFTVFAERRIVEKLWGADVCALEAALGRRDLDAAVARFAEKPELTHLRTKLDGIDPDEVFSEVPYEKGYLFLRALEQAAGRVAFDRFLMAWVREHRFGSVTSDDFAALVERELPGALAKVDGAAWLDGAGVPPSAPVARSARIEAIATLGENAPSEAQARAFRPVEWQLWLEALPRPGDPKRAAELDARFGLTQSRNYKILESWLGWALAAKWAPAIARTVEMLGEVGRMKYLKPLYRALAATDPSLARETFARFATGYHPIAREVIAQLLR